MMASVPACNAYAEQALMPRLGPGELGISADAKLARWDRTGDIASIAVPALVIAARPAEQPRGGRELCALARVDMYGAREPGRLPGGGFACRGHPHRRFRAR